MAVQDKDKLVSLEDLKAAYDDLDGDISDVRNTIIQEVNETISDPVSGTTIEFIPFLVAAGLSYFITVETNNSVRSFSLQTRNEESGQNVEVVLDSSLSVENYVFTAEYDAKMFRYVSTTGATVKIRNMLPIDGYNEAKIVEDYIIGEERLNDNLENGYIYCKDGAGSTVNPQRVPDSDFLSLIIPCSAGDRFKITGTGANAARLWCFTDTNHVITDVANASVTESGLIKTAYYNGYFIANVYKNYPYSFSKLDIIYTAELVQQKIDAVNTEFIYSTQNLEILLEKTIVTNGAVGTTVDITPEYNSGWQSTILSVSQGDNYILYGYGGNRARLWCLTDSSYKILSSSAASFDARTKPVKITIAQNGYLIINSTVDIRVYKSQTKDNATAFKDMSIDIADIKKDVDRLNDDAESLLNIPLVEFDLHDYNTKNVSAYRERIDYSQGVGTLLEQFYSLYDSLVTDYPDYVSKADAAQEVSLSYPEYANGIQTAGTYEITPAYKTYIYKFIDHNAGAGNGLYNKKKKLFITCAIHGRETMSPFNTFIFASELCKSTDPNYFKLRAAFDIYIIPCVNGYGMYHNMRSNANWVDINRNFPTDPWFEDGASTIGDTAQCVYTGSVAGSEFETQLIMAQAELINPDMYIDHHNYSGGDQQFYTNVIEEKHLRLVHQCLVDCSIAFAKNYPAYFGDGYLLVIPNSDITFAPRMTEDNKNGKVNIWFGQNTEAFVAGIEIASDIRYYDGEITQNTQDWAGATTFSIGEYTLRNQILRYGQEVLSRRPYVT